ncbi:hypothetical protein PG990_011407 [Apiospora arundinis]
MASNNPHKGPDQSPTSLRMHPSNPFFTPAAQGGRENLSLPTSPSTPENRRSSSTNPFRRVRDTPILTRHTDEDSPRSGSPVTPSPRADSDPDSEILHPDATAGAAERSPLASPVPGSPQERTGSQPYESTALVPMSSPAGGNIPVDNRARRSGRQGLNLHVHWPDHDHAAAASFSPTQAPQPPQNNNNEQPTETTTTTPEQPQDSSGQPPANPPNQPPTTSAASEPGANPPNNMFFVQQPHVACQGSVPMIMTNPPYVMPRQTLPPNWGPWCYPKQCQSPFWTGTAHHLTSRPMYIHTGFPAPGMPAAPIYQVGPQTTYFVYH